MRLYSVIWVLERRSLWQHKYDFETLLLQLVRYFERHVVFQGGVQRSTCLLLEWAFREASDRPPLHLTECVLHALRLYACVYVTVQQQSTMLNVYDTTDLQS